jgi:hypothetical protein
VKALCLQQEKTKDRNASCFFIGLLTFGYRASPASKKDKEKERCSDKMGSA